MRFAFASQKLVTRAAIAAVLASFAFTTTVADAKPRKRQQVEKTQKRKSTASASSDQGAWRTGSAAIIIDANTGKVLYEENADAQRHPASVTKIMTLYLLFEQIEAGKLRLNSPLSVSARAASQSPSKLNVRPGSTIEVEDAIKALVTRSANDVAVVIAEAVGGTESNFAEMMTAKARALGMSRTTFRNASGLPNPQQLTTARDLAVLGRAIQDRFPKQYRYFSTRSFVYRGETIGNHNRLLGRIEGVDGIKTGYTRASGFNLVTSVHTDDKFLIGVVLGGRSAGSRDARMADLISDYLPRAYAGRRTAPKIVETAAADPVALPQPRPAAPHQVAALPEPQRVNFVSADPVTTAAIPAKPAVAAGSAEPIRPTTVRTVTIQRPTAAAATGSFSQGGTLGYAPVAQQPAPIPLAAPVEQAGKDADRYPQGAKVAVAAAPVRTASLAPTQIPSHVPAAVERSKPAPVQAAAQEKSSEKPASARSGWMIQIGAFGAEREAKAQLDIARSKAKSVLGGADPFTEKVSKGSTDLYRARFAGLDEKSAKSACRLLQRNDFACMTIKN